MITTSGSSSPSSSLLSTRGGRCGWVIDGADEPELGPHTIDTDLVRRLTAGEGTRFRLGETSTTYAECRYLGPDALRHAPLTHYGYGWLGATWIDYETRTGWQRLRVPLLETWRARRRYPRYWLLQGWIRLTHALRDATR